MTDVRPAASADPSDWLLQADVGWQDLVRCGPPGFDVYLRIALEQEPQPTEDLAPRTVLAVLAHHTATPRVAYAAVWEGWGGTPPAPAAPEVPIPNRTMLLFTGPVAVLRDAPALAWGEVGVHVAPHLAWPEDRAWCLACEVDEEIEFTVGCGVEAARAVEQAMPGRVRRVEYGNPGPAYVDP